MSIMNKINIKTIVETINVSENLAGKYLRGVSRPSFENIYKLNKSLSIPFDVWLSKEGQKAFFKNVSNNNMKRTGSTTINPKTTIGDKKNVK